MGKPMATSQDFVNWVCSNAIDYRFLKYVLLSERRAFLRFASGTTHQTIYFPEVKAFHVCLPPTEEQRAIADTLSALDDKIELNRRVNETLETMARALFKSWFVNFDPVRAKVEGRNSGLPNELASLFPDSFVESAVGEVPKAWPVGTIRDVAALNRESVAPTDHPDEVFDHYSIPAYDEGRAAKQERGASIKSHKSIVTNESVLVSKLNPRIPRVWLPRVGLDHRAVSSTEFLVLRPHPPVDTAYLYSLFSSVHFAREFEILVTGTSGSHQRVRPESLLQMTHVVAPHAILARFADYVRPLLTRASAATRESLTLAEIRDALLPKLVAGELRVRDAERLAAAST